MCLVGNMFIDYPISRANTYKQTSWTILKQVSQKPFSKNIHKKSKIFLSKIGRHFIFWYANSNNILIHWHTKFSCNKFVKLENNVIQWYIDPNMWWNIENTHYVRIFHSFFMKIGNNKDWILKIQNCKIFKAQK